MSKDKFQEQIWTTRISRINAEKRLINKEKFFQGINIYYSCVTIIFSILSLLGHDDRLSLMTVFMTITLFTVILYLNSQRYLENAREYRKNYTQLHMIELELKHVDEQDEEKILEIEKRYCELLDSSSNHASYDYYCTVYGSKGDYREENWKNVRCKFYLNWVWRAMVVIILLILPPVLYWVCEVL